MQRIKIVVVVFVEGDSSRHNTDFKNFVMLELQKYCSFTEETHEVICY